MEAEVAEVPEAGAYRDEALNGCVYMTEAAFVCRSIWADHRRRDQDNCIYGLFIKHREKINASRKQNQRAQQLPPIYTDSNQKDPATDDFIPSNTSGLRK